MARAVHAPALTGDPTADAALRRRLLAGAPAELRLPAGRYALAHGLTVGAGWTVSGADGPAGTWLSAAPAGAGTGAPLLHVTGSDVRIERLGLAPAPSAPGLHGGDRGTALTVGRFLYAGRPDWVSGVSLARLRVRAPGREANAVAVMGAVRDVDIDDLSVTGGCTGLAVHWGCAGRDVSALAGPTYHPHRLRVAGLRVRDAFEGFYLSAVHDVQVAGACLTDVDIGFRLLAGDNTDRFHPGDAGVVGSRIDIAGVCVAWRGRLYGARVAGWGRSAVDGRVTTLAYRDVSLRDCSFTALDSADEPATPVRTRAPVVLEQAYGVRLRGITMAAARRPVAACCALRTG
ncbi:MAG TPA: hypothetical protein VES42_27085 [Pilimelia sp.]|nr:hypothetical protein [Pilimelia sp.]